MFLLERIVFESNHVIINFSKKPIFIALYNVCYHSFVLDKQS